MYVLEVVFFFFQSQPSIYKDKEMMNPLKYMNGQLLGANQSVCYDATKS